MNFKSYNLIFFIKTVNNGYNNYFKKPKSKLIKNIIQFIGKI